MDTWVEENPATGSHRVELPSLARLRMASVADQHVDASEPAESAVRCNSQCFPNGGKEAIVVPDEAWRRELVRELLQLTCNRRRSRERLFDQDGFASGKNRLCQPGRGVVGDRNDRGIVRLGRQLADAAVMRSPTVRCAF